MNRSAAARSRRWTRASSTRRPSSCASSPSYPRQHGDGVLVESVVSGCAADGELYPGDRILAIEGEQVDTWREASRAIEAAPSGATLAFDLSVDGEPESVDLVREPCGGSEDPLVGVSLINSFPFDVEISSGEIGGPSAGLMWALGLYDLLTPGDLTGRRDDRRHRGDRGRRDGGSDRRRRAEGGGGGRRRRDACSCSLQDNAEAAVAAEGHGLELVPVASFDEAVAYLHRIGRTPTDDRGRVPRGPMIGWRRSRTAP